MSSVTPRPPVVPARYVGLRRVVGMGSQGNDAARGALLTAKGAVFGLLLAASVTVLMFSSLHVASVLTVSLVVAGAAAAGVLLGQTAGSLRGALATNSRREHAGPSTYVRREQVSLGLVLSGLVSLAESRDAHTGGHSQRVVSLSIAVGKAVGMDASELEELHWAALLHDIGKVAVPESILTKKGRLSEEELEEIRRHPVYGADLVASLSPRLACVAATIRAHHERWDGRGYPANLVADQIPLASRIVAIADVYEALTTERPYREALTAPQAMLYIRRGSGTQFDPHLVDVFERLISSTS